MPHLQGDNPDHMGTLLEVSNQLLSMPEVQGIEPFCHKSGVDPIRIVGSSGIFASSPLFLLQRSLGVDSDDSDLCDHVYCGQAIRRTFWDFGWWHSYQNPERTRRGWQPPLALFFSMFPRNYNLNPAFDAGSR